MCFFHFKLVSIVNPKKLNSSTFSMLMPSIFNVRCCICFLGIWKVIYLDLFLLSDNLFIFNHSITLSISALIKLSALALLFMSQKESIVLDNVVSSAYMIKSNLLLHWGKSFTYIINNIGPRIEPCGTPTCIGKIVDVVSSISVYCWWTENN